MRIFVISNAMQAGYTVEQIHGLTRIDRWFLQKLMDIVQTSKLLEKTNPPKDPDGGDWGEQERELLYIAKRQGFSGLPDSKGLVEKEDDPG